jgi:hypothetical protein
MAEGTSELTRGTVGQSQLAGGGLGGDRPWSAGREPGVRLVGALGVGGLAGELELERAGEVVGRRAPGGLRAPHALERPACSTYDLASASTIPRISSMSPGDAAAGGDLVEHRGRVVELVGREVRGREVEASLAVALVARARLECGDRIAQLLR